MRKLKVNGGVAMIKKITKRRRAGYTFVELLVVISIIGVLVSLALVGLRASRYKAKDVQRKSDLVAINRGVELYATEHAGKYPVSNSSIGCDSNYGNTLEEISDTSCAGEALRNSGAMDKIPQSNDPNRPYTYQSFTTSDSSAAKMSYALKVDSLSGDGASFVLTPSGMMTAMEDGDIPYFAYTGLAAEKTSSSSVKLAWYPASDNYSGIKYLVSWSSGSKEVDDNTTTIDNLSGAQNFKVQAIDQARNYSAVTLQALVNFNSTDVTAPVWGTSSVTKSVTANRMIINLPWNFASDVESGLQSYVVDYTTDSTFTSYESVAGYPVASGSATSVSLYIPAGTYYSRAWAIDKAGNKSVAKAITNTVITGNTTGDFTAPVFVGSSRLEKIPDTSNTTYKLYWERATDNVGVVKYQVQVTNGSNTYSPDLDPSVHDYQVNLKWGIYNYVRVYAYDAAGNKTSQGIGLTPSYDQTAPVFSSEDISVWHDATYPGSYKFTFNTAMDGSTLINVYRVVVARESDGEFIKESSAIGFYVAGPATITLNNTILQKGVKYRITVYAPDAVYNQDPISIVYTAE